MKRIILLFTALFAFTALQAQWVNNAASNTLLANTSADAGEVYLATDPVSGDTYVQWSQFVSSGGWGLKVQRLNSEGVPQWPAEGLLPCAPYTMASYSQGFAMAVTTDNAVVSCFSTEAGHSVAVKINADGTFVWGEQGAGITLFGGAGGSRTELLAGDDGGVWAMATDLTNTYVCYIEADGTTNPTITISDDGGKMCTFGQMVPAPNGNVFVVYEKEQWSTSYFYEKDVRVVGYSKDGTQISNDIQLMAPVIIPGSYIHHVVPDGFGGGYVYIWHAGGTGGSHNTYVFHFDQYGANTINDPNGIPVHSIDPSNLYLDAYATLDPVTHDLIIAYQQTDSYSQSESRIYANCINVIGERLWGEGRLVAEYFGGIHYGNVMVDAFEYGGGFSVIFTEDDGYNEIVKAVGMDDKANQLWATTMSSSSYPKAMCENSTGFREGQNVIAWVNSTGAVSGGGPGGLYGQNIGWDGTMGDITPPTPPASCFAPTNFSGEYYYSEEMFGALLNWDAPETTPHHYNLYREGFKEVIEIDPENTSYLDELSAGDYVYKLTAVYDDCESDYALTETGENYVFITVTGVPENTDEEIVTVTKVYTLSGQMILNANLEELSQGVYIIQGLTKDGKLINKKTFINK